MNDAKIIRSVERNSNLELYRVIVMLLIVAHHFVVNSGVMERMYENPLSANSIFLFLFGAWGKTGINCFLLITGYFMCKSKITLKKIVKLMCEVLFYNIVFSVVFLFTGYGSLKDILNGFLIIRNIDSNNFTACFLVFYLFIPFLNILLQSINKKQHQYLIVLLLFLYTFLGTMPKFSVTMNYVSWFSVLYIIATYIRIYPIKQRKWGWWTLFFVFISSLSVVCCLGLGGRFGNEMAYRFVYDSNTYLALATGFCSFMYFKDLNIKQNKLINILGGSTFGVLCIHANSNTMRSWLWSTTLNVKSAYLLSFTELVVFSVTAVLGVYLICTIIDRVRIRLIEKPFLKFIYELSLFKMINERFELF